MGCYLQLMTERVSLAGFDNSLKIEIDTDNAWKVTSVYEDDDYVLNHIPFIEVDIMANSDNVPKTPRMCISYILYLKQNQEYYRTIFKIPLFASLVALCAATYCNKHMRYSLICLSFVVLCLSLISLPSYAPGFYNSRIGNAVFQALIFQTIN